MSRLSLPVRMYSGWLAAAAALVLGSTAPRVTADVAFTTFGPNDAFATTTTIIIGGSPLPPPAAAIKFSFPWPARVESITLALSSTGPESKTIEIWTDGAGGLGPGSPIASMPVGGVSTTPGIVTVTSSAGPSLSGGTTYWLILRQGGTPVTRWYPGTPPTTGTWYLQDPNVGTWLVVPGSSLPAVRINADPPGACCATDLTCVTLTHNQCNAFHGDFRGPATVCSPSPCIVNFPQGACCQGLTCSIGNNLSCNPFNGQFLGAGTTCTPVMRGGSVNPCCRSDFNYSGAVSVQDLFDFLAAYFSTCP